MGNGTDFTRNGSMGKLERIIGGFLTLGKKNALVQYLLF